MTFYPNSDETSENPLLNGCYEHVPDDADQTITAAGLFGVVGSLVSLGTSGVGTVSRQAFTAGQTDVPGEPRNFLRWALTTGATAGTPQFAHKIEDVRTFAGKKVTLQGFYRSNAVMPIRLRQDFGTGGSPSADVNITPAGPFPSLPSTVDVNGTAQWRPFTVTFDVPSINGKTIGTTDFTSYLAVDIIPALNTTFQFDITMMRLVPGGQSNPIVRRRSHHQEVWELSRYYHVYLVTGTGTQTPITFQRRMTKTPTMTASAGTASNPTTDSVHLNHTVNVAVSLTADARIAD
jgi:hypothetical protein